MQKITLGRNFFLKFFFFFLISTAVSFAQCPTISDSTQSFCDADTPIVEDLSAIDNGNGVVWYSSDISTTPLAPSDLLVNGLTYFADDNTGSCGVRESVTVTVYGEPTGQNFQGVCVDNANDATVADLIAVGNNVQWYMVAEGGTPISSTTILNSGSIYFAGQTNPDTGCETSRLAVFVTVGVVPTPTGDPTQTFCNDPSNPPTVADLAADGADYWYDTETSAVPLTPSTPLIDGENYFATQSAPPCESTDRFEVVVSFETPPYPGESSSLQFCESEVASEAPFDLYNELTGLPADQDGTWTGPLPTTNGYLGTVDISTLITGSYTFTYTTTGTICPDESSSVTITVLEPPFAGDDGAVEFCSDGSPEDLFASLGGIPEAGGTWSPALSSGSGIFDPAIDSAGTYTYTVASAGTCPDDTATVNVSITEAPDAGENVSVVVCSNDSNFDLFDALDGTPDAGGTWDPPLTSGTNIFDPAVDVSLIYTYTVQGTFPCTEESSIISVEVSQAPDAGEDASIEFCSNDPAQDLLTFLGGTPDTGGVWTPALASGTGVFDPAVDTAGTYTYTASAEECVDDTSNLTVTITDAPDAGMDASIEFCDNEATTDLFTILNGTPNTGGTWSPALASGTGVFDPTIDVAGDYTYTVEGIGVCEDATATVSVIITEAPDAGTDGTIDFCSDTAPQDLFNALGGTPDAGGTWSPALTSGNGIFDPTVDAAGTYTYTVTGTGACPDDTALVTVSITVAPDAGIDGTATFCTNDAPQNLFDSLGGTPDAGGTWSPALTSGSGIFDPAVDTAGTYTYTILGTGGCTDATATVVVNLNQAPNAGTDAVLDLCSIDSATDLFTVLGGTPDVGGTWTPALASGSGIFDPNVDIAQVYTYTVTGTAPCGNDDATVTVSVQDAPDAGNDSSMEFCSNDAAQDLFTALGGTPDVGGTWSPALASGSGIFDPAVDTAGTYTYTVTGIGICGDDTANVVVTLNEASDAGIDGNAEFCDTDAPEDLFASLGGNPDVGGIWTPALTSGTGVFDPAVDEQGIYTYTVAGNGACEDATATVTVVVNEAPDAGENVSVVVCSSDSNFDLFAALPGTPDAGGTWTPALASGTNIFDPSVDTGASYTYTVTGMGSCDDAQAIVSISVMQEPNAGDNATAEFCSNDTAQDLFDFLGGTPDAGGTWSPALNSGTGIFDPSVDVAGIYTYSISGQTFCPDDSATVTVTVTQAPDAGSNATIDLCNNDAPQDLFGLLGTTAETGGTWSPALASGSGIFNPSTDVSGVYTYTVIGAGNCEDSATVTVNVSSAPNAGLDGTAEFCTDDATQDLFTFIGGTPDAGGTWSPTLSSGTGIFNPAIDVNGIYTYTVAGTGACDDASATVTVTVTEAPDAGTNGTLSICEDAAPQDLFDSLGGTPDAGGTWAPALSSGTGIFDPSVDLAGTYTYTVAGTGSCGDASASVDVTISQNSDAGIDAAATFCTSDSPQDLFAILGGTPDVGGTWSPALASGTGIFDPSVDIAGVYTYTVAGTGSCQDATATVTVTLSDAPDAGTNGTITYCETGTPQDLFDALGGTPDTGGTWSPALASGTGSFDPTVDAAGTYTYTVAAIGSCPADSATVTVSLETPPSAGNATGPIDICTSASTVNLSSGLDGTQDAGGTWTDENNNTVSGNLDITGFETGTYSFTYTVDGGVCSADQETVSINITAAPNAGNGPTGTVTLCTSEGSINLLDYFTGDPDVDGTWTPALASGTNIFDPLVDTAGTYIYTVSASAPCTGVDTASITVDITTTAAPTGTAEQIFCAEENITIGDLDINGENITWYADNTLTTVLDPSETVTTSSYFATQTSTATGCESDAIEITVTVNDTPAPSIIINTIICPYLNPTIADLTAGIQETGTIVWYDAPTGGNILQENSVITDNTTYYASITGGNGCESSERLAVPISFEGCDDINIPEGFSPNGDGQNDTFIVENLDIRFPNFTWEIFNRYGNLVYKGNANTEDWDGTSNQSTIFGDDVLPTGVYFYILKPNDGTTKPIQGTVYLSR